MLFYHFIDGLSDKNYDKQTVEVALVLVIRFNMKVRNISSIWWEQGFVPDHKLFRVVNKYIRKEKS